MTTSKPMLATTRITLFQTLSFFSEFRLWIGDMHTIIPIFPSYRFYHHNQQSFCNMTVLNTKKFPMRVRGGSRKKLTVDNLKFESVVACG